MSFDPEKPLDRMPGESKRAYAAFYDYAMMGAGARSMRRLLEGYRASENPITKSWVSISHWSANHCWVERADRFDELTRKKAIEAHEARWRDKVIGSTEVLGRLSEQATVSIADFITLKLVPASLIIPLKKDDDDNGEEGEGQQVIESGRFVQVSELNWEAIKANGHLIKSITNTRHGPRIELHDGQTALINMGRHHKLFTDTVNGVIEHKNNPEDNDRSDELNRSVSALAQALREILPGTGSQPDGQVVTGE